MSQQPSETNLVRAIIERLLYAGALAIRVNSGAVVGNKQQGRGFVRFVRWFVLGDKEQSAGVSDLIVLLEGKTVYIEVKLPGNVPTEAQMRFAYEVKRRGGLATVITSLDELEVLIEGLKR